MYLGVACEAQARDRAKLLEEVAHRRLKEPERDAAEHHDAALVALRSGGSGRCSLALHIRPPGDDDAMSARGRTGRHCRVRAPLGRSAGTLKETSSVFILTSSVSYSSPPSTQLSSSLLLCSSPWPEWPSPLLCLRLPPLRVVEDLRLPMPSLLCLLCPLTNACYALSPTHAMPSLLCFLCRL